MQKKLKVKITLLFLLSCFIMGKALGAEIFEIDLVIENHRFFPEVLVVPANKKIKIRVHNHDKTAEEFESFDLKKEKIVPGYSSINIILAPLKPGNYRFFGDFNQETAKGVLRVLEN